MKLTKFIDKASKAIVLTSLVLDVANVFNHFAEVIIVYGIALAIKERYQIILAEKIIEQEIKNRDSKPELKVVEGGKHHE